MSAVLPFVGRDREVTLLRSALDSALVGQGALALVSGEAGIGKTTLAEHICDEAAQRGALVLTGRCYDLTETAPFAPWIEIFSAYQAGDGLPEIPQHVARFEITKGPASQAALFTAIQRFLIELTAVRPVVLLLDDQHWADNASLDLLRFLARQVPQLALMILVTFRVDEVEPLQYLVQLLPLLVREARALRLNLRPLANDDLWSIVRPRYQLDVNDEARLTSYLLDRTEGNPFFAGELLQTLEDEGVLQMEGDVWHLGSLGGVRTPLLVEQIIGSRLAQLSNEEQQLLEVTAVLGQEVALSLWGEVAGVDEDALLEVLDRASRVRLMTETADGRGARFAHALVRQVIYNRISPARRRRLHRQAGAVLAAGVAPDPDAVANHFRRSGDPRAAEWLIRAGERAEVAYSWQAAAERFEAAVLSMREAGGDVEQQGWLLVRIARMRRYAAPELGLEWLEEAGRIAGATGSRPLAATAMRQSGLLHCMYGNIQHGIELMRRGVEALAALTPDEYERFLASEPFAGFVPDAFHYRGTLALWMALSGRYAEALEYSAPYLSRDTIPEGDDGNYGDANDATARAQAMLGNPEESTTAYTRARMAYGDDRHDVQLARSIVDDLQLRVLTYEPDNLTERRWLESEAETAWKRSSGALANSISGATNLALHYIEGRWSELRDIGLELRAHGTSSMRAKAAAWLGPMARAQGDIELARDLIDEWLPAGPATQPGNSLYRTAQSMQRLAAELAIDAGDLPTGEQWLEACERWLAWNGSVPGRAPTSLSWAAYHRAAGDLGEARRQAEIALRQAGDPRQPFALLAAHRLLGELDIALDRYEEAASHLDAALTLAEACAAPYERALTLLVLAELDLARERSADAAVKLGDARSVFESLEAEWAMERAAPIAARLDSGPSAESAPGAARAIVVDATPEDQALLNELSPREVDVLRLLPAGLTNQEIADMLYVSPKTVENHIGRILAKTELPNRAAAAAFAQRVGLA